MRWDVARAMWWLRAVLVFSVQHKPKLKKNKYAQTDQTVRQKISLINISDKIGYFQKSLFALKPWDSASSFKYPKSYKCIFKKNMTKFGQVPQIGLKKEFNEKFEEILEF